MGNVKRFEDLVLCGPMRPTSAWVSLHCGPLRLAFDPETGAVRRVMLGDREILRSIYFAVRDSNWETVAAHIEDLQIKRSDDGFHVGFVARCQSHDVEINFAGDLSGDVNGTVRYVLDGRAQSAFRSNRVGLCVLHPLDGCVGRPCVVTHVGGAIEQGTLPKMISPHQPFLRIRAFSYEVRPGLRATVDFEGDVFEMEDQRNWTDASFKTYCRPLSLPFPFTVAKGETIRQSVTHSLAIDTPTTRHFPLRAPSAVAVGETQDPICFATAAKSRVRRLPSVGLAMPIDSPSLTDDECRRLRALNLAHVRIDVHLPEERGHAFDFLTRLHNAATQTARIDPALKLECVLIRSTDADSETFQKELGRLGMPDGSRLRRRIARMLVFHDAEKVTPQETLRQVCEALSAAGRLPFPIISGTDAYFAELNRSRPSLDFLDGVCYSLNPQVHVFDNLSLVENLAAQAETVRSARAIAGSKRVSVSPVTLRPRFNPNATAPQKMPLSGELPSEVDARQMSLFGAGWTLGSLKYLCESGVHSATYYETTGWRGVMETETGSPLPERFPSLPSAVFPLYHVLADFGEFRGGIIRPVVSSSPLKVEGVLLQKTDCAAFLCANLTGDTQSVTLPCPDFSAGISNRNRTSPVGRACRVRLTDSRNAEFAMRAPQRYRAESWQAVQIPQSGLDWLLPPYGLLRLNFEEGEYA